MTITTISRRELLKGTGALVVSFGMFGPLSRVLAQTTNPFPVPGPEIFGPNGPQATSLDSWVAVAADGTVTIYSSKVDLGTGVLTSLSQICAEELDVPFSKVHMETGDTSMTIDQAATVGSATIFRAGPQLRQASAAARVELLKLASAHLNAPVEKLTVTDGVVTDGTSKVSYAELVGGKHFNVTITATGAGQAMKVAPEVKPKDPKTYKVVGTSAPRVDLPPKLTGEFTYTADVRVPGMLHGRVVRPPRANTKPLSVDENSISSVAGIVKVVQEGSFVGVVAKTEWAAIQAARKLKVTWTEPESKYPTSREAVFEYLKNTKSSGDQQGANKGNVEAALAQSAKPFEATYLWPFQNHAMMGPSCAVADVQGDKVAVWAGSQGTFGTRKQVSDLLGIPEKNVRVIYRESSGCYGRLSPDDVPLDAALMSRAVGKPVRVQWSREDEHGWEPKGPAQYMTVRAATDASGKLIAWDFLDRSFPWTENRNGYLAAQQIGHKPTAPGISNGNGGGGEIYNVENIRVAAAQIPWVWPEPMPLRTSNLRAPGAPARTFASESAIDEIASNLGVDPVAFRLTYLTDPRIIDVLNAVAKQAKWEARSSPSRGALGSGTIATGRGVAAVNHGQTVVAAIAEVEVNRINGKISVKRVTIGQDCGLIINPDGTKNQIEGNVVQGVSRSLFEEVKFDSSGITSLDWIGYPVVRFPDIPTIDVVLVNRPDMQAFGSGEPSLVPVPAAIANAVFDATGARLREIPLTPERVLAALKAGASSTQLRNIG
jgi:nicotinate dehydrogenase subunit B